MNNISGTPVPNLFLTGLTPDDLAAMTPHLETVTLPRRFMFHDKDEPIEHVFFPGGGMVSLLIPMKDGALIEAGVIGNEGAIGLSSLTGHKRSLYSAMVQLPANAARIRASVLHEQSQHSLRLMNQVLLFSYVLQAQVSQAAACNSHHGLLERLAGWLLKAHDRAQDDELALTQELMAMMLGCRRPGVTVAANTLQQVGAIRYGRGHVIIRDRRLLESSACECYAAQRDVYREFLSWPAIPHERPRRNALQ
jgi:CRP-like cAMP-binding protein